MRSNKFLALLSGIGLLSMGQLLFPIMLDNGTRRHETRHRLASGKIYVSRSRYTPGGANRNCGDRGISPKRLTRSA